MIPAKTSIKEIDNLGDGEEIEFSIGDARWVMRSMSELYSDKDLAPIREYSTNAYDAALERALLEGTDVRPIEVTLPTMMDRSFRVRDYGFGMSREVLRDVYTKFGESTKRESNDFNGMLGFGSKSALAYTTTFTVVSICKGIKTVAVVTRKADWSIVMKIVAQMPTTEESGTEIEIPVSNPDQFTYKAMDFYKFWLPGRVLVRKGKGVFSPTSHAVGDKITDNLYYPASAWDNSYVVMGNVPYVINNPRALFEGTGVKQINFVAYVDNADVEFVPSREALMYSDQTKDTLKKVITEFASNIKTEAQDEVNKATTHAEAYKAWKKWVNVIGKTPLADLEFNGDKFVDEFPIHASRYEADSYYNSTYKVNEWYVEHMHDTLIITDFTPTLNSHHKTKAKEYRKHVGLKAKFFLFTDTVKVESPWIDPARVVAWEDLKAALPKKPKKPRPQNTGPRRLTGSWDYYTTKGLTYEKPLPTGGEVYYVDIQREKGKSIPNAMDALGMDDKAAVIRLPKNRKNKFLKENPQVKEFIDYATAKVVKDGPSLLSKDAKITMGMTWKQRDWLNTLDVLRIDEPEFARLKALLKQETALAKPYNENLRLANSLNLGYNYVKKHDIYASNDALLDKYPLLKNISTGNLYREEVYIYINAVYAKRG